MKKIIAALTCCLGLLSGTAQAQSSSLLSQPNFNPKDAISGFQQPAVSAKSTAETTFQIGIPGRRPQDSIQGQTISTAQIDGFIQNARSTLETTLPEFTPFLNEIAAATGVNRTNTPTRDLANLAFGEVQKSEAKLSEALMPIFESRISGLKSISSFNVTINPATVTVSQLGTGLSASIEGINLQTRFKAKTKELLPLEFKGINFSSILCGTVTVTTTIRLDVSGRYNTRDGVLDNANATASVKSLDLDCTSPLGNIAKAFVGERQLLENFIEDEISDSRGDFEIGGLFSINRFLKGLEGYCAAAPEEISILGGNIPIGNRALSSTIPGVQNFCTEKVRATVDLASALLDNNFPNSGLQVQLKLIRNSNSNFVSLTTSHDRPSVNINSQTSGWVQLQVTDGANTKDSKTYVRHPNSWNLLKNFGFVLPGTDEIFAGQFPNETAIVAIGESRLISGLYSFPSDQVRTEVQQGCLNIICQDPNSPGQNQFGF